MNWDANHIHALLLGNERKPDVGYLPDIRVPDSGPAANLRESVIPTFYDEPAKHARLQTLLTLLDQPEVAEVMAAPRARMLAIGPAPDMLRVSAVAKTLNGDSPCGVLVRKQVMVAAGQYAGARTFSLSRVSDGIRYSDAYGQRVIPVATQAVSVKIMNGAVELGLTPDSGTGTWTIGLSLPDSFDVMVWLGEASSNVSALFSGSAYRSELDQLRELYDRSNSAHIQAAATLGALVYQLESARD